MKYVDKLENKLMKKMKVSAHKVDKYKKRLQQKKLSETRKQTAVKRMNEAQKDFKNYNNAYQGVKTVNDAFKSGGTSALTDFLFKKEATEKKKPKYTITVGELE
jgi:beta-glucosidase-like glycosyl hydrolase